MKIYYQLMVYVICEGLLYLVVLVSFFAIFLFPATKEMDKNSIQSQALQVFNQFGNTTQAIRSFSNNYAKWPPTTEYVVGKNPTYTDSLFSDEVFFNPQYSNINTLVIKNKQNKVLFQRSKSPDATHNRPLPQPVIKIFQDSSIQARLAKGEIVEGFLQFDNNMYAFSYNPIIPFGHTSNSYGSIFMMRLINIKDFEHTLPSFQLQLGKEIKMPSTMGMENGYIHIHQQQSIITLKTSAHVVITDGLGMNTILIIIPQLENTYQLYQQIMVFVGIIGFIFSIIANFLYSRYLYQMYMKRIRKIYRKFTTLFEKETESINEFEVVERGINQLIEEVTNYNQKVSYDAVHDPLTGLYNRLGLLQYCEERGDMKEFGVLFLDVDKFKSINDTYGHHVGDGVLQEIARRIMESTPIDAFISRISGDEFVVLIYQLSSKKGKEIAGKLNHALQQPIEYDGETLSISVSIGVVYAGNESDINLLLKYADNAMYQVKKSGRNAYKEFDGTDEGSRK